MDLATRYYHKVCELEKKLNQALARIGDLEKEVNILKAENMELKEVLEKPFILKERKKMYGLFQHKLHHFTAGIPDHFPLKKLRNLKDRMKKYENELLLCLIREHVPPHNNHAEQSLRHSVIKRKISFGSKSDKGCSIFSINMSVLLTLWRRSKQTFFSSLRSALGQ